MSKNDEKYKRIRIKKDDHERLMKIKNELSEYFIPLDAVITELLDEFSDEITERDKNE